jgi:hypothetical protein
MGFVILDRARLPACTLTLLNNHHAFEMILVVVRAIGACANPPVAVRTKTDNKRWMIGAAVANTSDVIWLEIWGAVLPGSYGDSLLFYELRQCFCHGSDSAPGGPRDSSPRHATRQSSREDVLRRFSMIGFIAIGSA